MKSGWLYGLSLTWLSLFGLSNADSLMPPSYWVEVDKGGVCPVMYLTELGEPPALLSEFEKGE